MQKKDIIYFGMIFILIAGCFYMIHLIKSETSQCLRNPFVYGASKMGNIECSCTQFMAGATCPARFYFNDTTFDNPVTYCSGSPTKSGSIDFSLFNITSE